MQLETYSLGVGDRFGRQGEAQLQALERAAQAGVLVVPVWNKSFREHRLIGTQPADARRAADAAVRARGWPHAYYLDADHINRQNVDAFLDPCDFFTLDVADAIGQPPAPDRVRTFLDRHARLLGTLAIPGLDRELPTPRAQVEASARQFLSAAEQAAETYRRVEQAKGRGNFITEVSLDESDTPQSPVDLLVVLAALADAGVPVQTLAPKFSGRFNKGVDYVGDLAQFTRELEADLAVLAFARQAFGLPANLKLSVHSGSDKFSLYAPLGRALRKFNAGLHLKTAGTTWLEEVAGLAAAGGDGLRLVKEIYAQARARRAELGAPYAAVIAINEARLPAAGTVAGWSGAEFAAALRHDPQCPAFNPDLRQLLHVSFKIAAELGARYLDAVAAAREVIAANVTENLYRRHLCPLFGLSA